MSEDSVPAPTSRGTSRDQPAVVALLWSAAAALAFWCFGHRPVQGSDLWWHLAAGRWMTEERAIPRVDSWSYTAHGRPWLHDAWLSDLLLHGWTIAFGVESLVWWRWGLTIATFLVLFSVLHRVTAHRLASFVAALLAIAIAAPFLDIRPQLYSLLGFALVISAGLTDRPRRAWLPLVFIAWANLHAMWTFGLAALAILLAPEILAPSRAASAPGRATERRRALLVLVACALAALVNPHGIAAASRAFRYAFDASSPFRSIAEWTSPFVAGGIQSKVYPWAIALCVLAVFHQAFAALRSDAPASRHGERGRTWAALALACLTLAVSLRTRRLVPFFALGQALVVAPALARWLPDVRGRLAVAVPLAIGLASALWLMRYPLSAAAFPALTLQDAFPVEVLEFVEANRLSGKVFALYNWGGYVEFRTRGDLQVYIDGRADMVFDDDTYRRFLEVLAGEPGSLEKVIEASGADFVLWPRRSVLIEKLVRSGRWRYLYEDSVAQLMVRVGHPLPSPLMPTPPSPWRDLAIGRIAIDEGRAQEAERHLAAALDAMPGLLEACVQLARVQAARGAVEEALATRGRCGRIAPDAEIPSLAAEPGRSRADSPLPSPGIEPARPSGDRG